VGNWRVLRAGDKRIKPTGGEAVQEGSVPNAEGVTHSRKVEEGTEQKSQGKSFSEELRRVGRN